MLSPLPQNILQNEATSKPVVPPMPVALPADGAWTLGDSPLALGVEVVSTAALADRMAQPPCASLTTTEANQTDIADLLPAIQASCVVGEAPGGFTVYSLTQPRMKLRLFSVRAESGEKLAGGYLAYPRGADAWTLLVGTLKATEHAGPDRTSLLPLTVAACSIARRVGTQGRTQCEVVKFSGNLEDLRRHWERCGWTVAELPTAAKATVLSCNRGAAEVRVHVQSAADGDRPGSLLLIDPAVLLDNEPSPF